MRVPIMAGTTARGGSFAASYPVNLEPRAKNTGVSDGQLVSSPGAAPFATGPGVDRGGISWNGACYRVMGSTFCRVDIDGTVTTIGDVGSDNRRAGFDYSFDRLGIRSAGGLYYYDGATLTHVTDPDLGEVLDLMWIDGYFLTTDGKYLVATDLLDPTSINPLKYGSAEEDPDMVVGLLKYREEVYAIGRYTIQVFQDVGGLNFPFQVIPGATIPYGAVGTDAKCMTSGTFAFVGSGKDEPLGVYVYAGGTAQRISSREIDLLLAAHSTPDQIIMEARSFAGANYILIHLEDRTLALAVDTSRLANDGAWFVLQSDGGAYRLRNAVWCYDRHIVGDTASSALGVLTETDSIQFAAASTWQFDTALLFNDGKPFVLKEVELFGQFPAEENVIFFSMSRDGVQWSNEIARVLTGRRDERIVWRPNVRLPAMGIMRFRGSGRVAIARCEIDGEALL